MLRKRMIDILNAIKEDVEQIMTHHQKRLKHIKGVVSTSKKLALIHSLDPLKAQIIAWAHDMTKFWSNDQHQALIPNELFEQFKGFDDFYHGLSAAQLLIKDYHIDEKSMIDAVAFHTVGHPDFDVYGKLLLIADVCEPNRQYKDALKIDALAQKDLEKAYHHALMIKYQHVINSDYQPHPLMLETISKRRLNGI
jgi:predicted HD superfamily hydrolase involved in NAD metabolism